jgi:hypothetical protein
VDSKTNEKVLTLILEIAKKPNTNINFGQWNDNDTPGVSLIEFQAALAALEKLNLIKVDNMQVFVKPDAFGYLPALQEQKRKAIRDKWEPRIWQVVMLIIGFYLGRLSR